MLDAAAGVTSESGAAAFVSDPLVTAFSRKPYRKGAYVHIQQIVENRTNSVIAPDKMSFSRKSYSLSPAVATCLLETRQVDAVPHLMHNSRFLDVERWPSG